MEEFSFFDIKFHLIIYLPNKDVSGLRNSVQKILDSYPFAKNIELDATPDFEALKTKILEKGTTFIFSLEVLDNGLFFIKKGIPVFTLQTTFSFIDDAIPPETILNNVTRYYCLGKSMKDLYFEYWKKERSLSEEDIKKGHEIFVPSGGTIFKTLNLCNREEILKKYGIPENKKVVLYLPPHIDGLRRYKDQYFNNIFSYESRIVSIIQIFRSKQFGLLKKLFSYRHSDVLKSIKKFCKRNDAFFVIKVRDKNLAVPRGRPFLNPQKKLYEKYGDKIVMDEAFYPYASLELMFVADLVLHFKSSSILELIAANTRNICILLPLLKPILKKQTDFYEEGLTCKIDFDRLIKEFPHERISSFPLDDNKRNYFIKNYFVENYKNGCKNIVKDIISLTQ